MATDKTVAMTILNQLGNGTLAMLGATGYVYDAKSIMFKIRGSEKYNKIRITLAPSDTYTVEFIKLGRVDVVAHETFEDIYVDSLHDLIKRHTGLDVHMPRVVGFNA